MDGSFTFTAAAGPDGAGHRLRGGRGSQAASLGAHLSEVEILSSSDEILSSSDEIRSSYDEILSSYDEILSSSGTTPARERCRAQY
jgi:hypothetical protein